MAGGAERWTTGHAGGRFRRRWCREVDHRAQLTAGDTLSPFDRPFDRLRDRLRDRREIPGQAGHDGKSMSSTGPSTGSGTDSRTAGDARSEPGMTWTAEAGLVISRPKAEGISIGTPGAGQDAGGTSVPLADDVY